MNISIITILATIFGVIMGLANIPQAYKIFRRKSAKDISIITYTILLLGSMIWIIYGIALKNFAIILGNSIGTVVMLSVIVGWWRYH